MSERRAVALAIAVAVTSAALRLVTLQWLHPLNWDEVEFYRAARWVAEGRLPFRDFWEHHTPVAFFLFAPFTRLTDSPGAGAIIVMRWAQVPVWIATFWLTNLYMRTAGLARFARWAAMAIALSATILMNPAVEFRLDPLACLLFMGGLVAWQRGTPRWMFAAGVFFCLTGLVNMRMVPLLAVTVLLLRVIDTRNRAWQGNSAATWMYPGGIVVFAAFLLYLWLTGSWEPAMKALITENALGNRHAQVVYGAFPHRLLTMFGVRVMGSDRLFDWGAIDLGGIAVFSIGVVGFLRAVRQWRTPDDIVLIAILQAVNLIVIAGMKFIYVYHFEIAVILMLPLIASVIERMPRRGAVYAILGAVWCVNAFASLFRGKELDLAYQDLILREVHARTGPEERVFSGTGWGLRREPAYHLWFLPDMTKYCVWYGHEPPYALAEMVRNPPAVVVLDHSVMVWVLIVQRELAPFVARHYVPVWGDLWVPGLSARLKPNGGAIEWIVPRDGEYRLFASPELARHVWFVNPYYIAAQSDEADPQDFTLVLPPPAAHPQLRWWIDRRPANVGATVRLRKGQRIAAVYSGPAPLGVFLVPGDDKVLFRKPPGGATLEASTSRETHIPRIGATIR